MSAIIDDGDDEQHHEPKPSKFMIWWAAVRPHTLTASVSPCLVAFAATRPPQDMALAFLTCCVTIQIGTNLYNDYADFIKGADTHERIGHARATAKGWWTPEQTSRAAHRVLSITYMSSMYLLAVSKQWKNPVAWFLIASSLLCAYAYTGFVSTKNNNEKYPKLKNVSISYSGLGEIFVLLYFGYLAVLGLPYLLYCMGQSIHTDWVSQFIYATQVGLLATNILIVNNLRDRETDLAAAKNTTIVRFGRKFGLVEYTFCVATSYALLFVNFFRQSTSSVSILLPLLTCPWAMKEWKAVMSQDGHALNPHVGGAAKLQLVFCILLAIGIVHAEYSQQQQQSFLRNDGFLRTDSLFSIHVNSTSDVQH